MLQSSESETEILLGNKQLVGIFIVVAVLLGVAFTAGYMAGHNGGLKKPAQASVELPAAAPPTETAASPVGGQTHTVGSDDAGPLHTPTQAKSAAAPVPESNETYSPHPGAKYLQVAAVSKDEAEAVADVLHKKGFRAHAVPKPGNAQIYRVIIGPIRDAGDLSSTRDALRNKAGFREVIVQTY